MKRSILRVIVSRKELAKHVGKEHKCCQNKALTCEQFAEVFPYSPVSSLVSYTFQIEPAFV